jgi:hypothetical protein
VSEHAIVLDSDFCTVDERFPSHPDLRRATVPHGIGTRLRNRGHEFIPLLGGKSGFLGALSNKPPDVAERSGAGREERHPVDPPSFLSRSNVNTRNLVEAGQFQQPLNSFPRREKD